ncbi:MAG: nucleotidyltransferase domain-containing protein [Spirochaetales bacterium]|jgi:uncharacterized protein|nr:nucleotidyltransferase domain-containing protein [Spirochaetales bacterium]
MKDLIVPEVISTYPQTQAIYLFGSHANATQNSGSDIDIAVLLPPDLSKTCGNISFSNLRFLLEAKLKSGVDLINIRLVSTVFKKEIICNGERIFCASETEADTFEMLTISYYCKLNEERKEILDEFLSTKRAYAV